MATDPPPFNDPFGNFDGQRTFVKPTPGGFGSARQSTLVPSSAAASDAGPSVVPAHGLNPLLTAANPLLLLVPKLRHTRSVTEPAALRATLVQAVRDFEADARRRDIAPERAMAARYVLCTMLDEAASDTPWGGGVWSRHSLLAEFHNESFGGEKVFQLMARLAEKPAANLDLLELIYAAVALGFEGRYRVIDGGRAQLEAVRSKLAELITRERGAYPAALAEHWHGSPAISRKALGWLPLALATVLVLLLLGGLYALLSFSLAGRADPVYAQVQGLRLPPPVVPVAQPAPEPRLAQFLRADIKAELVVVRDEIDRSVVTLRGDGLFASGSATIEPNRQALMRRIADALLKVRGPVLVTGHTDNTAIKTARFPSNWHLSDERARAVRELMIESGLPPERIKAEGRADGEPVVPNDSAANRALNRRVDITLFTTRPEAAPRVANTPAPEPAPKPRPATGR
ncbi:MAG: DotU family type VI secretion system protein [Pseudomonadota bacterium]|nr:DotU family type VI secretion system protein [Pseudomonadota bacterium]